MLNANAVSAISKQRLLKTFDGSSRKPRASQVEAFSWLADNWSSPGLVLQLPTGVGKSAIARALQLQTGAAIITPNNLLLQQYADDYTDINPVFGSAHYPCGVSGDHTRCEYKLCEYQQALKAASKRMSVFNPMSFIKVSQQDKHRSLQGRTVIIDEAHKLTEFLRLLISYKFPKARYKPPAEPSVEWIRTQERYYRKLGEAAAEQGDYEKSAKCKQNAACLSRIAGTWEDNPAGFITYWTEDAWCIDPLDVPRDVIERALGGAEKVILLSATIPPRWAKQILGHRKFQFLDLPSPIPKENRKIVFDPAGLKASSEPQAIALWIKRQLERYQGNAIVHTTYSMGLALSKFFPDALVHTKQTKQSTLREFKRRGGVWLAAGASEGIDLSGTSGRVNLIPVLPFANNREPLGRALFERDPYNYYLETAVTYLQQCGRTTRGVDDWSVTVCGDNRMSWLLQKVKADLPKSFAEAIVWS